MEDIKDEDVKIKMSVCQKCNGIIRVAVAHQMTTKSKNDFAKEAMKYDLAIKTISLFEYRQNKTDWCKCASNF